MQFRKRSLRFSLIFLGLLVFLGLFSFRLVFLQVFKSSQFMDMASKQHNNSIELEPVRGTIYDREMRPMAFNVFVYSMYANTRIMTKEDKANAAVKLSSILDEPLANIEQKLAKDKYFVWIKRKIPIETAKKVQSLKLKGIAFRKESKRYYPNGALAAHLIGFAGVDNRGLEGLELYFDTFLKGAAGRAQILRDAKQRELMIEKSVVQPQDGYDLVLTIDETIQYIAEQALDKAFHKHNAKSAMIIVLNPRTGEILALANRPTYNLEDFGNSDIESRTNRAVSYVFEPGSVFKIVTASAALEEKQFTESDKIFCENGAYKFAGKILHDHTPHGTLAFHEVFKYSSNIGTSKIAQKLGPDKVYEYAHRFRFGLKTGVQLAGEVDGWLKKPSQWSKTSLAAIPMGQEVTVTPLQLIGAMASIANDGVYMKPYLVKEIKDKNNNVIKSYAPEIVDQVISADTARRVKSILKEVVDDGTGKTAQIKDITVAGKTGTAQKVVGGLYSHSKFYATFYGFAPVEDPQLAAIVVVDEPHPSYFGGTVSAPVFREVVENSLKYLSAKGERTQKLVYENR